MLALHGCESVDAGSFGELASPASSRSGCARSMQPATVLASSMRARRCARTFSPRPSGADGLPLYVDSGPSAKFHSGTQAGIVPRPNTSRCADLVTLSIKAQTHDSSARWVIRPRAAEGGSADGGSKRSHPPWRKVSATGTTIALCRTHSFTTGRSRQQRQRAKRRRCLPRAQGLTSRRIIRLYGSLRESIMDLSDDRSRRPPRFGPPDHIRIIDLNCYPRRRRILKAWRGET